MAPARPPAPGHQEALQEASQNAHPCPDCPHGGAREGKGKGRYRGRCSHCRRDRTALVHTPAAPLQPRALSLVEKALAAVRDSTNGKTAGQQRAAALSLRKCQLLHPAPPYYPCPREKFHTMGNTWDFTVG